MLRQMLLAVLLMGIGSRAEAIRAFRRRQVSEEEKARLKELSLVHSPFRKTSPTALEPTIEEEDES